MRKESGRASVKGGRHLSGLALGCVGCIVVFSHQVMAQAPGTLERLTEERQMLTAQLDQYRKSMDILQTDGTPPEQSANPAVRSLATDAATLKQQLIVVTEQEVTLLQQEIIAAKSRTTTTAAIPASNTALNLQFEPQPLTAIEGKPLRMHNVDYTQETDAGNVEHLHQLLEGYYAELQESSQVLPTSKELAQRETSQRDAEILNRIPFSVDKVRLNGTEGSAALAGISQRLMDPRIPESRRDIAPICIIKTRLFDTLVSSENRSLKPVGKNHYIAKVRLQPGTTTLSILSNQWEVQLPQQFAARDYLITLYHPVDGTPELHVFAVDDLLTAAQAHIPAWLPAELDIKTKAG